MSDYLCSEEVENKLSVVILQVQEGKTSVCIRYITESSDNTVHIVLTMNTLKSGMQFFKRLTEEIYPKNIIVFNSDEKSAGKCHHAKDTASVMSILIFNPNIKVIICCAHKTRFKKSIHELFTLIGDSKLLSKKKYEMHIDEGHLYIKQNRNDIVLFNKNDLIVRITNYSGTPYATWGTKKDDPLFNKIYVRDIKEELGIIRTSEYFGSKSCEFLITENEIRSDDLYNESNFFIPDNVFTRAGMLEEKSKDFFGYEYYFNHGNEIILFGHLDYILPKIEIDPNTFSYHFVPAYIRLVTHYNFVEIILKHYPTANVIVDNGNGTELYRLNNFNNKSVMVTSSYQIKQNADNDELKRLQEPSYMVEKLIEKNKNFPTFITGFNCVGMSVTFINQNIGNFDTCIMAHGHFQKDILRQLCRMNFNYTNWSPENKLKIKKTKIYSLNKSVADTFLSYEENIEYIIRECVGSSCTLRELKGLPSEELTCTEIKTNELNSIIDCDSILWKPYKVYDGNDSKVWKKVYKFYEKIMKKKPSNKSKPKFIDGVWQCSTAEPLGKKMIPDIEKVKKYLWWSTHSLVKSKFRYARIFVGYENKEEPSEYTIYVKFVKLKKNSKTKKFLKKYAKNKSESDSSSDEE